MKSVTLVSQDEDLGGLAQDVEAKTVLSRWSVSMSICLIEMKLFGRVSDGQSFEILIIGSSIMSR